MQDSLLDIDKLLYDPPEIGCVLALMGRPFGGGTILDNSPYGNNGTIYGATWKRESTGLGSLYFITDDYINLDSHIATYASLTTGTLLAWVKPGAGLGRIFSASDKSDASSDIYLNLSGTNVLGITVREAAVTSLDGTTANNTITQDVWQLVGFSVGVAGNALYINGVAMAVTYAVGSAATQEFFNSVNGLDTLRIGNNEDSGGQEGHLEGYALGERILSASLTATQHLGFYNGERHLLGV